jgi:hypothetical protein
MYNINILLLILIVVFQIQLYHWSLIYKLYFKIKYLTFLSSIIGTIFLKYNLLLLFHQPYIYLPSEQQDEIQSKSFYFPLNQY